MNNNDNKREAEEQLKSKEDIASEKEDKKKSKKPEKKSQAQILQETLGLEPGTLENIEQKLFIARFLDYFSEEPIDFIYREKDLEKYKTQIEQIIIGLGEEIEEDKLIKQQFTGKQISQTIDQIRENTEEIAAQKGFKKSINKKMRNWSLIISAPMFAVVIIFTLLPYFGINIDFLYLLPVLCVFCMVPTLIRNYLAKKWYNFKEENKMDIYTQNRENIMILKGFVNDTLRSVRSRLIDLKVPLELIKFVLSSNDYDSIKVLNQQVNKGAIIHTVRFDYPAGVEPFPIPDQLAHQYINQQEVLDTVSEVEKNFVILENAEIKDGKIENYVPALKENLAEKINEVLNECEFKRTTQDIKSIFSDYSSEKAIYCKCGEMVEIKTIFIANWKGQFKFYMFEGVPCDCGEKVYALSLMDKDQEIPDELKDIF
ncbi:MAG: hypothetical protein BAJALOKI1v1_40036 [Promethearchaeota archaeon]|nr:MAG: hypothetical protein BAJALOKI1v1_40036 [Candidatus Lokiarchaeota archaeon]